MSVEKVDKYKEDKKNRKQEIQKQKIADRRRSIILSAAGVLVILALVAGIVATILNSAKEKSTANQESFTTDSFMLNDFADIRGEDAGE